MNTSRRFILSILLLAPLAAFAQFFAKHPKIDVKAFPPPKTIVLVDIPHMVPVVHIGILTMYQPGKSQPHFTEVSDRFFDVPAKESAGDVAKSTTTAPEAPSSQGLIPDMIFAQARETNRRAVGFEAEVLKRIPDYDLRIAFMKALVGRLEANGVAVKLDQTGHDAMPRLRWPAHDVNGTDWPAGAADSAPAVDADLLVQICPVAFYLAPGGLNSYRRSVTVAVAVYDGRTKKFYGRQTFRFVPPDSNFEYGKYDSILADLDKAAPALRDALETLGAPVADVISGKAPPE